jgi:hypothetical protein
MTLTLLCQMGKTTLNFRSRILRVGLPVLKKKAIHFFSERRYLCPQRQRVTPRKIETPQYHGCLNPHWFLPKIIYM